jgi:SAM-dependent methyltransferase
MQARDAAGEFERRFVRPRAGRTLIVGSRLYDGREDRRTRYPDCVGLDMLPGPGVDLVHDLEKPLPADVGKFDHIECCSVLEHSRRPWDLAANLQRAMRPAATLHISAPFVWRVHAYPNDYWRFTMEGVRELFPAIVWQRLMFANTRLREKALVAPREKAEGVHPYLPRTEVLGFGARLS